MTEGDGACGLHALFGHLSRAESLYWADARGRLLLNLPGTWDQLVAMGKSDLQLSAQACFVMIFCTAMQANQRVRSCSSASHFLELSAVFRTTSFKVGMATAPMMLLQMASWAILAAEDQKQGWAMGSILLFGMFLVIYLVFLRLVPDLYEAQQHLTELRHLDCSFKKYHWLDEAVQDNKSRTM